MLVFALLLLAPAVHADPVTHPDPPTISGEVERRAAANAGFGASVDGRVAYTLSSGWCGTSRGTDDPTNSAGGAPQFKLVYAYAADQPDRLSTYAPVIQRYARFATQTITSASGGVSGIRFDTGLACDPNAVDILTVRLAAPRASYLLPSGRLERVKTEVLANPEIARMRAAGPKNVVIFADGLGDGYGAAGEGEMYADDRPGTTNPNARGGVVSLIWGRGGADFFGDVSPGSAAEVVLHEISHNLGAVQLTSPNSSGGLHCSDETDVMCYNDGTPTREVCAGTVSAYDCGRDDYFNPGGPIVAARGVRAGQSVWNVAASPFLCPASACASTLEAPTVSLSASTATPAVGQTVMLTASVGDGDGYIQRYSWDRDGDGVYEYSSATVGQISVTVDAPVDVGVHVLDNDGLAAVSRLRIVPSGAAGSGGGPTGGSGGGSGGSPSGGSAAPTAALDAPASIGTRTAFTLSATGSRGSELSYEYDLDGDGQAEYPGPSSLAVSYPTAGSRKIGVRVTDSAGRVAIATRTITVTGTSSGSATTNISLKASLSRQAIADAIKKGVPARLTSTAGIELRVTVTDAKTRKRYGQRTLKVRSGTTSTRIPLTSAAKKALRRKSRVSIAIQGASASPAVVSASVKSSLLRSMKR